MLWHRKKQTKWREDCKFYPVLDFWWELSINVFFFQDSTVWHFIFSLAYLTNFFFPFLFSFLKPNSPSGLVSVEGSKTDLSCASWRTPAASAAAAAACWRWRWPAAAPPSGSRATSGRPPGRTLWGRALRGRKKRDLHHSVPAMNGWLIQVQFRRSRVLKIYRWNIIISVDSIQINKYD